MLKSNESLKIMGNSIYWQLKYVDLVEDISVSENENEI